MVPKDKKQSDLDGEHVAGGFKPKAGMPGPKIENLQ